MYKCELCGRIVEQIEFHHFFPGKKRRKSEDGINVCLQCGDQIHLMFDNSTLRSRLNNLPALKEAMHNYLMWIKDKPESRFSVKKRKRKS